MVLSVGIAVTGLALAYGRFHGRIVSPAALFEPSGAAWAAPAFGRFVFALLTNRYYIEDIYRTAIIRPLFALGDILRDIDNRIIDGAVNGIGAVALGFARLSHRIDTKGIDGIVNGIGTFIMATGKSLRKVQTGYVQNYALILIFLLIGGVCEMSGLPVLTLLIVVPIIGSITVALLPAKEKLVRYVSLVFAAIPLALSTAMYFSFLRGAPGFRFVERYSWFKLVGISYYLGIDGLSFPMVFLSALLTFLAVVASFGIKHRFKGYYSLLLLLEPGMIPVLSGILTFDSMAALGLPALSGFIGEFLVLLGALQAEQIHMVLIVAALVGIVMTAGYMLVMVQKVTFGKLPEAYKYLPDASPRELVTLVPLMAFVVSIGLFPSILLGITGPAIAALETLLK